MEYDLIIANDRDNSIRSLFGPGSIVATLIPHEPVNVIYLDYNHWYALTLTKYVGYISVLYYENKEGLSLPFFSGNSFRVE